MSIYICLNVLERKYLNSMDLDFLIASFVKSLKAENKVQILAYKTTELAINKHKSNNARDENILRQLFAAKTINKAIDSAIEMTNDKYSFDEYKKVISEFTNEI
ncbi:hypothetical protein COBT_000474 [Conglomerata obtusa]